MTKTQLLHSKTAQYASLTACVLSCILALLLLSTPAQADVRSEDVIVEGTVQERGLSTGLCPNIEAERAYLVDSEGQLYFARNADAPCKVASITKIMTAITALAADPELSSTITIGAKAAEIGESSAALMEGDTMDLENALTAMLVASGNDAAQGIASSLGAKLLSDEGRPSASEDVCVDRFVQEMNSKASELGLENSLFTNPHGLDDGEFATDMHGTASDVAKEVAFAMQNPVFRKIVGQASATVQVNRNGERIPITLESTNILLESYEGTLGVKTGTTDEAGACFAGANAAEGHELYSVVLGSTDEYQRFLDTQALWDWAFEHWTDYSLVNTIETVPVATDSGTNDMPLVARITHADWLDRSVACTVSDPQASVKLFDLKGNVAQQIVAEPASGNVKAGDVLGKLIFTQHNQTIAELDLLAAEDAPAPDIFTGIGIWWQRLWGNSSLAPTEVVNQTPLLIDKAITAGS